MKRISFAVFMLFALVVVSNAQISLKVGPMLGLTSPTSDYTGDVKDFYMGTKYGMRSGINFGAMGKIQFGPLNGRLSVVYASLSNDGNADPNYPNSTGDISNKLVMFTLGTEFGFGIPFSPVKPYAGIDLLFSTISGNFNFNNTPEVTNGERSIASSSRTGLGFAIGSEIAFGKSLTLDLSLRYNLINLFGKSYEGVSNSNDRKDAYLYLNDAADPNYSVSDSKHPIGKDRSIATIQLQLGILFGF